MSWYWYHRSRTGCGSGGAHQAHHSSAYFNLGAALRQKWNPWLEPLFWLPIASDCRAIFVAFAFNLIYQFFTHTEMIGRLPRPIEYVFNTPSHHRVHHASDPNT